MRIRNTFKAGLKPLESLFSNTHAPQQAGSRKFPENRRRGACLTNGSYPILPLLVCPKDESYLQDRNACSQQSTTSGSQAIACAQPTCPAAR